MRKAVIVPDSFKGTLASTQVCEIVARQVVRQFPECEVVSIPVADGGEGSVACFVKALGGSTASAEVAGPRFAKTSAAIGLVDGGKTAVVEAASCAGLPLVEGRPDPSDTTTFGVGELILAAAERRASKIVVCLGGSCTNDGGCGAAAAAGVRFLDAAGNAFVPTGGTLGDIDRIDVSGIDPRLSGIEIVALCDIDNPLCGAQGAARVFAPQKGADGAMVERLDRGLAHLARVIRRDVGINVERLPGAGAAGGLGAGMVAFFGAKLRPGIQTMLDAARFDDALKGADCVITGEGRLDGQSARDKVVLGVAKRAARKHVPVIAFVGGVEEDADSLYDAGLTAVFPINRLPEDFSVSKAKSEQNLASTARDALRLIAAWEGGRSQAAPRGDASELRRSIEAFQPFNEQEAVDKQTILHALDADPDCFNRSAQAHMACSIWVVDPSLSQTLLVYHNIYDSWSWIGGHADGETDLAAVALRELQEETGVAHARIVSAEELAELRQKRARGEAAALAAPKPNGSTPANGAGMARDVYSLEVLTVDGHEKRGRYVGSHLHLNVTYLAVADPREPIRIKPDENSGVRWVPIEDAVALSTEPWIRQRVYRKLIDKLQG